jgi:hypothetical protein
MIEGTERLDAKPKERCLNLYMELAAADPISKSKGQARKDKEMTWRTLNQSSFDPFLL